MADILWGRWQAVHITERHGVERQDFEEAWDDPARVELAEHEHPLQGRYFVSLGRTSDRRVLTMVWRWQGGAEHHVVWPITAFFPGPQRRGPRRSRRERRSR